MSTGSLNLAIERQSGTCLIDHVSRVVLQACDLFRYHGLLYANCANGRFPRTVSRDDSGIHEERAFVLHRVCGVRRDEKGAEEVQCHQATPGAMVVRQR